MVLAENIVTAIQRGILNTRRRDFADIYLLTGAHERAASDVYSALDRIASRRVAPPQSVLAGYAGQAQPKRVHDAPRQPPSGAVQ